MCKSMMLIAFLGTEFTAKYFRTLLVEGSTGKGTSNQMCDLRYNPQLRSIDEGNRICILEMKLSIFVKYVTYHLIFIITLVDQLKIKNGMFQCKEGFEANSVDGVILERYS